MKPPFWLRRVATHIEEIDAAISRELTRRESRRPSSVVCDALDQIEDRQIREEVAWSLIVDLGYEYLPENWGNGLEPVMHALRDGVDPDDIGKAATVLRDQVRDA